MSNNWNQQYLQYRQMLPMGDAPPGALPYTPPMVPGIGGITPPSTYTPGVPPGALPYRDPGIYGGGPSVQTPAVSPVPGMRPMHNPNPWALLGSAILGSILGGGQGAMAGAGGFAQGSFNARQAELQRQSQQQQLDQQRQATEYSHQYQQGMLGTEQRKPLDARYQYLTGLFLNPDTLASLGWTDDELKSAIAEANDLKKKLNYGGPDWSPEETLANRDRYKSQHPEMFGGSGWHYEPSTGERIWDPARKIYVVKPGGWVQDAPTGPIAAAPTATPTAPPAPSPQSGPPGSLTDWIGHQQRQSIQDMGTGTYRGPGNYGPQGDAGAPPAAAGPPAPAGSISTAGGTVVPGQPGNPIPTGSQPSVAGSAFTIPSFVQGQPAQTVTLPASMDRLLAFSPDSERGTLMSMGYSPEHVNALVAGHQTDLENKVKDDLGISQAPVSIQTQILSLAKQAADTKLAEAQAHFQNVQANAWQNGGGPPEVVEQKRHDSETEQQGRVSAAETAINNSETGRAGNMQALRIQFEGLEKAALDQAGQLVQTKEDQNGYVVSPIGGSIGTILGTVGLSSIVQKFQGLLRGKPGTMASIGSDELGTIMEEEMGGEAALPAGEALLGAVGGVPGVLTLGAVLAGGAALSFLRRRTGGTDVLVTQGGKTIDLSSPVGQKWFKALQSLDSEARIPHAPHIGSQVDLQAYSDTIANPNFSPKELTAVKQLVASGRFQDKYYSLGGPDSWTSYRLLKTFQKVFPGRPLPIRYGQDGSPFASIDSIANPGKASTPSPGSPSLTDVTRGMQAHPAGPTSPIPPPGQRPPATPASQPPTPPRPGTAEFGAQRARTLPHGGGVNF